MSNILHDDEKDIFYFNCPHCNLMCQVEKAEIKCTIFRHAVFKKNYEFVPPHSSKEVCDFWIKNDLVYGCGKPFQFDGKSVKIIDYI